jgi:hypothetical protein
VSAEDDSGEVLEVGDLTPVDGAVPRDIHTEKTPRRIICTICGRPADIASDDPPDGLPGVYDAFAEMEALSPDKCQRGLSGRWWWCSKLPMELTIRGPSQRPG